MSSRDERIRALGAQLDRAKARSAATDERARKLLDEIHADEPTDEQVPEQPVEADVIVRVVFEVDGKPVCNIPFNVTMPPAVPEGQVASVALPIDARTLMQLLEPYVGVQAAPIRRRVIEAVKGPAIIVPGRFGQRD